MAFYQSTRSEMDVLTVTTDESAPFMRQQMTALEQRGVSFRTIAVDGSVDPAETRGPWQYAKVVPRVLRVARSGEFDLLHAHYGLTAPVAVAQPWLPSVLSLWGSDVTGPVAPISRLCAPHCDEVVVMSDRMARALGHRCVVVPDGVDLDRFQPRPRSGAREQVGWTDAAVNVLFPYSPRRSEKNYERARRIVDEVDDLLEETVALRTVWGVPHERMPTYVNAADALLLTSRREGSPNAVKEAMACNVPVVATDVGDVRQRLEGVDPSYVRTTDRGLLDALLTVILRGERSNGREAAHAVSLERSTAAILAVYRRALSRPSRTGRIVASSGR